MTQRKGDNKSVSERIKEMLVGPGKVFLFVWIIITLFRIGTPWSKIGHSFVVMFCIWVAWCFFLDLMGERLRSWDEEVCKRRRRRRRERKKEEKLMVLNGEDPHKTRKRITRIIRGSASYIIALALWIYLSASSIKDAKEYYESIGMSYPLSDAGDAICDNFIIVFGIWIVLAVALSWLKTPTHIHIDRD